MTDKTFEKYKLVIDEWFINGFNGTKAYQKYYPKSNDNAADVGFREIYGKPRIEQYIVTKRNSIKPTNVFNYKKDKYSGKGVYVIQCIGTTYFKIGKATDVMSRFSSIQTGCPIELRIVDFIECDNNTEIEKHLHKLYRDKVVRGEWFHLNRVDLENIKSLKKAVEKDAQLDLFMFSEN